MSNSEENFANAENISAKFAAEAKRWDMASNASFALGILAFVSASIEPSTVDIAASVFCGSMIVSRWAAEKSEEKMEKARLSLLPLSKPN